MEGKSPSGDSAPCGYPGVGPQSGSLGEQNKLVLTEIDFKEERESGIRISGMLG